jgi:SAM-dependent methyltransferase
MNVGHGSVKSGVVEFMAKLKCPDCGFLTKSTPDGIHECTHCGRRLEQRNGIIYALPSRTVNASVKDREKAGWHALLSEWTPEHRRCVEDLPYVEAASEDYFHYREAARQFDVAAAYLSPLDGKCGLDLGGQMGWAAYRFSQRGAAMACLDYNDDDLSGLGAGRIYLEKGAEFERICADAEDLPLADAQFDFVFSSAFLHHLTRPQRALKHIGRVLKPGGIYFATTEAFCPFWMSRRRSLARCAATCNSLERGINEQVFYLREYRRWFEAAGLELKVINPRWDAVSAGRIEWNRRMRDDQYIPEILDNRRTAPGIGGLTARLLPQTGLWRPFASPIVFPLIRSALLTGTQKHRILVGFKA